VSGQLVTGHHLTLQKKKAMLLGVTEKKEKTQDRVSPIPIYYKN